MSFDISLLPRWGDGNGTADDEDHAMAMDMRALLAPVPYVELASAEEVCRRQGKVVFPTSTSRTTPVGNSGEFLQLARPGPALELWRSVALDRTMAGRHQRAAWV